MSEKWTEKDVLEHARELKSPFEKSGQNGQGKVLSLKDKLMQIVKFNRGQSEGTEGQPE